MKKIVLICFLSLSLLVISVTAALANQIFLPIVEKQAAPTPILTPTSPPPTGVQILLNHSSYKDVADYLHGVGEVQNNTGDNLEFVNITANFFNPSGQLLDTDFTYTYLDLPAWDKACFEILLPEPSGWSYYQFEAPTYWTDGQPLPILTILNDSGSYDPTLGWYEIIGQVRNDNGGG